ncbi:MAG: hypothetical protein Q8P95_02835 [bacterium]|nr:hypothetical protein [bacterium]
MTQTKHTTPGAEPRDTHTPKPALTPYVVSADIHLLLKQWAEKRGFNLPPLHLFFELRNQMTAELAAIFPGRSVDMITEEELVAGINQLTQGHNDPVVSLDRTYATAAAQTLEATRMIDTTLNSLDIGSRTGECLEDQVARIAQAGGSTIFQLVDDVIFYGESMVHLIGLMKKAGLRVSRIIAGIMIAEGQRAIHAAHPEVEICATRTYPAVLDEICERDFYAGVPFSGRLIGERRNGGVLPLHPERGAPYFLPFGKPYEWATIPKEMEKYWSVFCLTQSITLWKAVEAANPDRIVVLSDLDRVPGPHNTPTRSLVGILEGELRKLSS